MVDVLIKASSQSLLLRPVLMATGAMALGRIRLWPKKSRMRQFDLNTWLNNSVEHQHVDAVVDFDIALRMMQNDQAIGLGHRA